jgi:hypothetical protein
VRVRRDRTGPDQVDGSRPGVGVSEDAHDLQLAGLEQAHRQDEVVESGPVNGPSMKLSMNSLGP